MGYSYHTWFRLSARLGLSICILRAVPGAHLQEPKSKPIEITQTAGRFFISDYNAIQAMNLADSI